MIKVILKIVLGISTIVICIGGLAWVFIFLAAKHSTYSYFYEALDVLPETQAAIAWEDVEAEGRPVLPKNQTSVSIKITEAWQAYAMGLETGNRATIKDYFVGTALDRALHVLDSPQSDGANMVMMGMRVEPQVFHLDGSVMQLKSEEALFARYIINNDELQAYSFTSDCVLMNLQLRQSGWKISNFERECSETLQPKRKAPKWDLPKLKGINYYPKNTPWTYFWLDYDREIVQQDMREMWRLGANSLRIFLPKSIFTDKTTSPQAIEDLQDFLNQAETYGFYVVPTLFDFRGELTPWSWTSDRYYLDQVLPVLEEAKNIAYVDVKNELDLDEAYQSSAMVEAWLRTIMSVSREIAPELRYSLGWSDAKNAMRFSELFDVISYHEYGSISEAEANLAAINQSAGDKPVIISEIGATSFELALNQPSNWDKQARTLEARLNAAKNSDGVMIWTLYDYPNLDPKAVTGSFWHKGIQKNFGLFDKFETAKPAAKTFKQWTFE